MHDLLMSKTTFFTIIILPFFGGWILAWLTARLLVIGMSRPTGKRAAIYCAMLFCMTATLSCFGLINYIVVIKLWSLGYISYEQTTNFFFLGLPFFLVGIFFIKRSYKKITSPW